MAYKYPQPRHNNMISIFNKFEFDEEIKKGLKCLTSESHQYLSSFSKGFSDGFMELLRSRFGTKRVFANKVYEEYIFIKDHLQMNPTRWVTLSDYVKWLGLSGQCVVDQTEKGCFISYIDRSPEALEQQQKIARKEKYYIDDKERHMVVSVAHGYVPFLYSMFAVK